MKRFVLDSIIILVFISVDLFAQSGFVQAVDFDGSGDYANTFNNPYLPTPNGTIEAWVKVRSIFPPGGTEGEAFFAKNEEQWNLGDHYSFFDYSTGKLKSRIQASPSVEIDVQSNNSFFSSSDEWFHYAFTWGTSGMKMYINGEFQNNQNNLLYSALNNTYNIYVGAHGYMQHNGTYVVSDFFDGQIDELRIWNYQKNSQQILALKNAPLDSTYYTTIDSGLVGYWKFDVLEDLGINNDGVDDVRDFSVLHNHLDLAGDAHLVGSGILVGQTIMFEKTYGGTNFELGYVIDNTEDGGYIFGGSSASFTSSEDMYLLKLDSLGSIEWSKIYNSPGDFDRICGVKQALDGGYYISGFIEAGFGYADQVIMRLDHNGNIIWAKNLGGTLYDEFRRLDLTDDGGVLAAGYCASFGIGRKEVQVVKISAAGSTEWAKNYGTIYEDFNFSCKVIADGNFILAGAVDITGSYGIRPTLIKLDSTGNVIWAKYFNGVNEDWGRDVELTIDGGFILLGETESYGYGGSQDIYLIKTDGSGNVEWAKAYGGLGNETGRTIHFTNDGNYVVAGFTSSYGFGNNDAFLMKLNINGELVWFHTYGGYSADYGYDFVESPDHGFALVGRRSSNTIGGDDFYIVKTDMEGNSTCNFQTVSPHVFNISNLNGINLNLAVLNYIAEGSTPITTLSVNSAENNSCSIVPVELKSFIGKALNNGILLEWSTATELNNYGFEIERASEKTDFHTIAFIKGAGTTTEFRTYSYRDNLEYDGKRTYKYRLKQIDYNGEFTFSEIITVEFDIPTNYLLEQNFPNPFNPSTKIRYALPNNELVQIKVYDITGQLVEVLVNEVKDAGTYEVEFNTEGLSSGIYFYQMKAGDFFEVKKMSLLK